MVTKIKNEIPPWECFWLAEKGKSFGHQRLEFRSCPEKSGKFVKNPGVIFGNKFLSFDIITYKTFLRKLLLYFTEQSFLTFIKKELEKFRKYLKMLFFTTIVLFDLCFSNIISAF